MQDFIYHNPVKILFGHDQIPALAQEVPQDKKVMIVYGGGSVIKHGILQRVKGSLKNTLVFELLGVKTRLSDYDLGDEAIAEVIRKLKEHGHIALGEHGKITAREAEALLKMAL